MPTRLSLLLIALLGLLPYVSTIKLPPIPSFWAEWAAVVIALAWLASLRRPALVAATPFAARSFWSIGSTPSGPLAIPVAVFAFAAFGAVLLIQLVMQRPMLMGAPVLVLLALVLAGLVCIAGAKVRAHGETARLLDAWAIAVVIALVLNLAAVLLERQGWHLYIHTWGPREPRVRAEGLFGQPNHLAVFAGLASVAAHYLWMRGRLPAVGHAMVAFATGLLIAGSASRAGMLLWLAGTVLSALALRERDDRRRGWGLLVVSVMLFFLGQALWKLTDSGAAATVTVLRSDSLGRIELLRDSWALITRHPLAGVGYGNFMSARWTELSTSLFEPAANHAHNAIAQIAVELGLIGALAVLVPLCWALWRCARVVTRRGVAPEQFLAAAVALMLAGYSLVEYPLWYTFFLLPFALMLGLVEQPDLRPGVTPLSRVLRGVGFALSLAACAVVAVDYHRSETIYTSLELQQREGRGAAVRIPMQEAAAISVLSAFDLYANLMYSRALAPDGLLMRYKLDFTERAMLSMTNEETIGRQVALLVVADDLDAARELLARTHRNPDLERNTRDILGRLAHLHPDIVAFVKTLPALPPKPQAQAQAQGQ